MSQANQAGNGDADGGATGARAARAVQGPEESGPASGHRDAEIMAARAKRLSQPRKSDDGAGRQLEVLVFLLGPERVALETRFVRATSPLADVTPIPGTAQFVMGVTNFRGEIVPVFDIRENFNGAAQTQDPSCRIIFLGTQDTEFGIIADGVLEAKGMDASELRRRAWQRSSPEEDGASGITRDALNVLDGQALLNDARFFIDQTSNAIQP